MEEEIDIKDLIIVLWKKKWIIAIVTLAFAIIGLLKYGVFNNTSGILKNSNENLNNKYIAAETFILGREKRTTYNEGQTVLESGKSVPTTSNSTNEYKISIDEALLSTLNEIAKSKGVLELVINDLNLEKITISELAQNIEIKRKSKSDILIIMAKYNDEELCMKIVSKTLEYMLPKVYSIYNISNITEIDSVHILNEDEIKEIEETTAMETTENTIQTEQSKTSQGISKKKLVLFAAIGFVLSCGVIVVLELFNTTVKNEDELEKTTKLKTLVKINNKKEDLSDEFKLLRVNIKECHTILVTSPEVQDGKTLVAENLAKSFARLDKKVILVDLTKNNSSIVEKYNGKGLSNYLNSEDKFVEKYAVPTNVKNLSMLLVGDQTNNMTENLEGLKAAETFSTLERLYDVVIIDSENVLESPNTLAMAKLAKYSILVSTERKTKLENVIKSKNNIEDVGGNVIGNVLVLNKAKNEIDYETNDEINED